MKINIKTIPIKKMRYPTVGDYWTDKKEVLQVRLADIDEDAQWLVLIHELIEMFLCQSQGISFESIDRFDLDFEEDTVKGIHSEEDEPGDAISSPYRNQHCMAMAVERMLCGYLGISFKEYEAEWQRILLNSKKKKK
jgi:hypothetical protein